MSAVHVPPSVAPMIPRTLFNADHEAFRATARRFFETEIAPFHEKWEEQQHIDRHLWNKAGELGLLCCTMPEEYGGSGFDTISFRSLETISNEFDRTRGVNLLLRRPLTFQKRLLVLAEFDKLSFSSPNLDNNRSNIFMKVGYQLGTGEDNRSNQISGDKNDRIRNLFTAYREIGLNGHGLSLAVTYGIGEAFRDSLPSPQWRSSR